MFLDLAHLLRLVSTIDLSIHLLALMLQQVWGIFSNWVWCALVWSSWVSGYSDPRETPRETPKATPRASRRSSEEDVARAAAAGASAALTLLLIPALKEVSFCPSLPSCLVEVQKSCYNFLFCDFSLSSFLPYPSCDVWICVHLQEDRLDEKI
jgi:hypothetical protein